MHLLAAGMRREGVEKLKFLLQLNLDAGNNDMLLSGSCHQTLHHTTLTTRFSLPLLPLSLHFSSESFNLAPFFTSCLLSLQSFVFPLSPAHLLSPPSPLAFTVIYLYLKAIMFSFFHQHISSVTLVPSCVLPHYFQSSPFI